ncbi:TonB-dependent receptor [bacterium]|nr:TonB-dependent receptor [bacterium]
MRTISKFILLLLFLPVILMAGTTGKIGGRVVDAETGEPLMGVNVYLENTYLGASTDDRGEFFIINIPAGIYNMKAEMIGYSAYRLKDIEVMVDLTSRQEIRLSPAVLDLGEVIEVVATRPIVQMDVTSGQSIVSSKDLQTMPVETITDILSTKAGITTGASGAIHIRGGRSSEVGYLVDGISVSDPSWGGMPVGIENSIIQELKVVSGTFNAEYGQAMSGIVNIVTKDGGDKLSGLVSGYVGDYISDHNDSWMNINDVNPQHITNMEFNLSGPVPFLGKKLKFFTSYRNYWNEGYYYGKREHNTNDVMFVQPQTALTLLFSPYGERLNFYENFYDANGNEQYDGGEPYFDMNANNRYDFGTDILFDLNNNGIIDGEYFIDYNFDGKWNNGFSGDSSYVSMGWYKKHSLQTKLTYSITPKMKLKYNVLNSKIDDRSYSSYHRYKYNPDGQPTRHRKNWTHILDFSHSISRRFYYTLKLSQIYSTDETYKYKDWRNPNYFPGAIQSAIGYEFYSGGVYPRYTLQKNISNALDLDITYQINNIHQVQSGLEAKLHTMKYHNYTIVIDNANDWQPTIYSPEQSTSNNKYSRNPEEFAFYIQDKIELEDMIINIGVRFDYFNSNYSVPADLSDTLLIIENRMSIDDLILYNAAIKHQWSPRLGISYPITDMGNIHFSYGHFFQIPPYAYLYSNPEFEIVSGTFNSNLGNANLNPQKTVKYEIGFTQGLTQDLRLEINSYYNDIKNLLSSTIHELYSDGDKYTRYANQDYGYVKGVSVSLEQRKVGFIGAAIDYTFQVARGNASDPLAVFYDNQTQPPLESEKKVVPLDWDQTHSLNLNVMVGPEDWGVSVIGRLYSGLPYTPQFQGYRLDKENSQRKPGQMTWDLYGHKVFTINNQKITAFVKIYNLFDKLNERYVFDDTGRATYSLVPNYMPDHGNEYGRHHLSDYLNYSWYYKSPREIRIGFSIGF